MLLASACATPATPETPQKSEIEPEAPASAPAPVANDEVDASTAATPKADTSGCGFDLFDDAAKKSGVDRSALSLTPLADVDGDGKPEHMLIDESQCGTSGNCGRLLYLSGNGCSFGGSFAAEVESEQVLPKARKGVHDLRVYLKDGCAGLEGAVIELAWDGTKYVEAKRIQCACPDTHPKQKRNPACP